MGRIENILADCAILPGTVGYGYLVAAIDRAITQNPPRNIFKGTAEALGVPPETLRAAISRTLEAATRAWNWDRIPEQIKRAVSARTGTISSREFVCTVAYILRQEK